MKKKGKTALSARLTALCMAALMAFSLMPAQTADAAGETYTKVTSAEVMLTTLNTRTSVSSRFCSP